VADIHFLYMVSGTDAELTVTRHDERVRTLIEPLRSRDSQQ